MSLATVGLRNAWKVQLGREVTPGTEVAATSIWRGMAILPEFQRPLQYVNADIGELGGDDLTFFASQQTAIGLPNTPATFEQLPHIFEASILTATPAQDGAGTGYEYEYTLPRTNQPTIKTYTIEAGDNIQARRAGHCFVASWALSAQANSAIMVSSNWLGQALANNAFTSLSAPTVEVIQANKGAFYVDAEDGTIGTTQVSAGTLLGVDFAYTSGWMAVPSVDGNTLDWSIVKMGERPELVATLIYEHNSFSETEWTNWQNGTARLMRLEWLGTALDTEGTAHVFKTLRVDVVGKYETMVQGEQNGNSIITATFRARPSATASLFGTILVVNELTTLP